jgi:hypothetical protein
VRTFSIDLGRGMAAAGTRLSAAGFGAATAGAFWVSVVHGPFGLDDLATGAAQVRTEVAECVGLVLGLLAAALMWRDRREIAA